MFVENLKETLNLGEKLSHKLNPQSIVLLKGPIGAGKTSFVQGIAKGLSISEDITSPTFALSHHYNSCLLYTSPSPRDLAVSRMPSSA